MGERRIWGGDRGSSSSESLSYGERTLIPSSDLYLHRESGESNMFCFERRQAGSSFSGSLISDHGFWYGRA